MDTKRASGRLRRYWRAIRACVISRQRRRIPTLIHRRQAKTTPRQLARAAEFNAMPALFNRPQLHALVALSLITACASENTADTGTDTGDGTPAETSSGTSTTTGGGSGSDASSSGSGAGTDTGGSDTATGTDTGQAQLCDDRSGGALLEFEIHVSTLENPDGRENWRIWVTDSYFIDEALRLWQAGEQRVPSFDTFVDGRDCDAQWSWHVDGARATWIDADDIPGGDEGSIPTDACDALPSTIEGQKDYWFNQVTRYCPRDARLLNVDDRRPI